MVCPSRLSPQRQKIGTFSNLFPKGTSAVSSLYWSHGILQMAVTLSHGSMDSWNALLSDSSFVKSHLQRCIHNNNDKILLFFRGGFSLKCSSFTARPSPSPCIELTNFIKIPVNPQFKNCRGNVIGSVNGLICFSSGSSFDDDLLHIWNPSLSAMLTLPPWPSSDLKGRHFRFGFDPKAGDYKVLKLTSIPSKRNMVPQVAVYSMRKGSWKSISQSFPSHVRMMMDHDRVCVDGHDGHLHWLSYADLEWKLPIIVTFDLFAETFCELPLPDFILHPHEDRFNVLNLGVLGGKLCVISRVRDGGECEVWVMSEYGVSESWVKHQAFPPFSGDIIPFGFTLKNEFLFHVDDGGLALYDPVADKTKTFKITGGWGISKIVEYVESLVWVAPAKT